MFRPQEKAERYSVRASGRAFRWWAPSLVLAQLAWTALFFTDGQLLAAIGTTYVGACVAFLAYFYGDHIGRVCFVIDRPRAAAAPA